MAKYEVGPILSDKVFSDFILLWGDFLKELSYKKLIRDPEKL